MRKRKKGGRRERLGIWVFSKCVCVKNSSWCISKLKIRKSNWMNRWKFIQRLKSFSGAGTPGRRVALSKFHLHQFWHFIGFFFSVQHTSRRDIVMWVFGYGSLIWKAGFQYDERLVGFVRGYRRVFYQGSTDHRGTPAFPGRTVTLEHVPGDVCWGVAYKVSGEEAEKIALAYLEVREKQYDMKAYLDFFTDLSSATPAVRGVMVYIASPDIEVNRNYLGPASLQEIAKQMIHAHGPSGPNIDYLFQLEDALKQFGCEDLHVRELANTVRRILLELESGL